MMDNPLFKSYLILGLLVVAGIAYLVISHFNSKKPRRLPKKLQRGSNYRDKYFRHNKGLFGKGIYFCPYCGRAMWKKDQIQVDHISSIHRVQNSAILRERFKKLPDGVNDVKNLVHACSRCNQRKGAKGGIWVFLGHFGQYFMPVLRLAVFASVIYLVGKGALFGGWSL